jgi:hypothetical protein
MFDTIAQEMKKANLLVVGDGSFAQQRFEMGIPK